MGYRYIRSFAEKSSSSARVYDAAKAKRPTWTAFFVPVHYCNPENGHPDYLPTDPPHMRDSLPWRLKEKSYAWQKEWRFIWLPDTELVGADPSIEFVIGSLLGIAVLERLKPSSPRLSFPSKPWK
jgi:hypothetical protein